MNIGQIIKRSELFVEHNASAILTAIGVTGTVTTAVLTGRSTFKAAHVIHQEALQRVSGDPETVGNDFAGLPDLEFREKLQLVWPLYIPPAGVGTVTVTSIIMANRMSSKKAAAMAAAYSMSEKRFQEYKDKVLEQFGVNKEEKVRDDIAQDRVTAVAGSEVIITDAGEVLCMDLFTGRFFKGTKEDIKRAENIVNEQIINHMYCSLNEFYGEIGLEPTSMTDELGWNMHTTGLVDVVFSSALTPDGRPCLAIDFCNVPMHDYSRH